MASSQQTVSNPNVGTVPDGVPDLRGIILGGDDVFWVSDLATGRLEFANPAIERFTGKTAEQLKEDPTCWTSLISKDDFASLPTPFFSEQIGADTLSLPVREYRIELSDGSQRWLRERRFIIDYGTGRGMRLCGIAEDTTARKASEVATATLLEREREARAEAEAVARSKDQFLSVVSHELRSPLNAIRGWTYVLKQVGNLTPVQQKALDAIDRNTQAQARLVDDLLDSQRILLGTFSLELHKVLLSTLVDEAMEEHRHAADVRKLLVTVTHDASVQAIDVDVRRMRQAIGHLVSNAVKFTPEGGSINISTRAVDGGVEVSVADTGIGIEPDHLPVVFERFAQADGSNTRRQGGLGIGLSLTRQLVELHGGKVEAYSDGKDRGARFVITLPDMTRPRAGENSREAADQRTDYPLAGCKIMVVDDDLDSREMLELILRETQAKLVTFESARTAYDYLAALPPDQRPDAVVSDIAMPEEDGYSFMRRVRSLPSAGSAGGKPRRMVALALTAFAGDEDRARSMRAGFDVHVGKPIDSAMLLETLRSALVPKQSAMRRAS